MFSQLYQRKDLQMKKSNKIITIITLSLCLSNLFFISQSKPHENNSNTSSSYDNEISPCNNVLSDIKD